MALIHTDVERVILRAQVDLARAIEGSPELRAALARSEACVDALHRIDVNRKTIWEERRGRRQ